MALVAVCRFTAAVMEPVVRGYTNQPWQEITADALVSPQGIMTVAEYDALFSLKKRRK